MTLGSYLKTLREEKGLSLREVEARCKVSNGYLSLLEHDKIKEPSPRFLWSLAQCYETDYLDLMRRAGYPVPNQPIEPEKQQIVFRGAERLNDEEREEIQDIITGKLRRRERRP